MDPTSTNRSTASVSHAELDVVKALWDLGSAATVRDVHARLAGTGKSWAYTTVQTLLQRLEEKGYVACDKSARAHVFRALVSRDDHLGAEIEELIDRVCDGTASPLVRSLVERCRFTPDEIEQFRRMLDDVEPE